MKKIIIFTGVALLLSSCNKFLDTLPDNRAELKTDEKIEQMLISAYPTELPTQIFELLSDNTGDNGTGKASQKLDFDQTFRFGIVTAQDWDTPNRVWQQCYRAISSANEAINAIEERGNPSHLMGVKAEALLCRAYGHFILAKTFCIAYNKETSATDPGLPYALKSETTVKPDYQRGTVKELYDRINADIEAALPNLVDKYAHPKYHFNGKAAHAFAANFNLFYGNWEKVVEYATIALGSNPSAVLRDWDNIRIVGGPVRVDRYYLYLNIEDPANFMLLSQRSTFGRYFTGSNYRYTHNRTTTVNTIEQTFPFGRATTALHAYSYTGGEPIIFVTMAEIWEESVLNPGTGQPHIVLVPFNSEETLMARAEAYAMLGEFNKSAQDLSYWYAKNGGAGNYSKEEISEYYNEARTNSMYEDMESRWLTSQNDMKANMVRACLAVRRCFGLHTGVRWPDMKRHGIRLTRRIWSNATDYKTLVVEPYSNITALQLPNDVLVAGLPGNPRPDEPPTTK